MDNEQIKLQLTDDQEVLEAMRQRKTLLKAQKGHDGEVYEVMFDSRPIQFRLLRTGERTILPLSASVAKNLRRDTHVLLGDPLNGEYRPALEEVGRYSLSEGDPTLRFTKTTCPFCRLECVDARTLAYHLSHQCESEEAAVPKFVKMREEETKRQAAIDRERKVGPSQAEINSRLTLSDEPNGKLIRAEEPVTVPAADDEDDGIHEIEK